MKSHKELLERLYDLWFNAPTVDTKSVPLQPFNQIEEAMTPLALGLVTQYTTALGPFAVVEGVIEDLKQ